MLLALVRQRHLVEVVVSVDGGSERLEILLLEAQLVHRIVDGNDVGVLHSLQIGLDQGQVVRLAHERDDPRVVDARGEHREQVVKLRGVAHEVELERLVVNLQVGNLDADVLEADVLPRVGVGHHHTRSVIVLVVRNVEERELLPGVHLLAGADELGDVDAGAEELEVLHELLGLELGVEDAELGEDAHVRPLQANASLHQGQELLVLATHLVVLRDFLQLVRVDDDVQRAQLCQPELALVHAREANLLPGARVVRLASRVNSLGEFVKLDQGARQPAPVGARREKNLSSLVQALVEASIADVVQLRGVGLGDELLELRELIRLCIRVAKLRVNLRLLDLLAHHRQVLDHAVEVIRALCHVDHREVVVGVLGLDIGSHGGRDQVLGQVCLREL